MNSHDKQARRRRRWRLALLLLVALPFIPELIIYAVAGVALAGGCLVDDDWVCWIVGVRVSDIMANALKADLLVAAGFGMGFVVVWLALCYLVITLGWARLISRLLLALLVSMIFAVPPYIMPMLTIYNFADAHCQPNEGGVGSCVIFGGNVGAPAHWAVATLWYVFTGLPLALAAFAIYSIFVVVMRLIAMRRGAASPPVSRHS
jgi:hypothetical protein